MEKVVVLQNDEEEARQCAERLSGAFEVIAATDDERAAEEIIAAERPRFLVTSLMLKGADGIKVIERTRAVSPWTFPIITSVISGGEMIRQAMSAGAVYYMIKPIDYSILIKRMQSIGKGRAMTATNIKALDEKISRIFIGIGIPPHIKGYLYLREGVKIATLEPDVINSVTKRLYPMIGEKYNTSASKVERAIRHAIEVAWNRGKIEAFNALFGVNAYSESDRPTNSEFIALIADRLLLDGLA